VVPDARGEMRRRIAWPGRVRRAGRAGEMNSTAPGSEALRRSW
jgi:hypothetical protein